MTKTRDNVYLNGIIITDMRIQRIKYLFRKIIRAQQEGTLYEKARRFLLRTIRIPLRVSFDYLRLPKANRQLKLSEGFTDHRKKIQHHRSHPEHLRRIIIAYKKAKQIQPHASIPFQIRGLWAEWIAVNFGTLVRALQDEDLKALSRLFENFSREQFTIGLGSGYDNYLKYRTSLTGRFYLCAVWKEYCDRLLSLDFDLKNLNFPQVGNPAGIPFCDKVIPIDELRHTYHAVVMGDLLRNVPDAVVVEIGGGAGGQAYQTVQLCGTVISKYLVFDIPEVAAISSYFLLSAFPEKHIRLFGEGAISLDKGEDYKFGVFPHFAITELVDQSVDLCYNSCSFSEMDSAAALEYLHTIERVCRQYFLHENHDSTFRYQNSDGYFSVNLVGSKLIPDPGLFKRVFKKNRTFCLPEDRSFPAFEYLYERM